MYDQKICIDTYVVRRLFISRHVLSAGKEKMFPIVRKSLCRQSTSTKPIAVAPTHTVEVYSMFREKLWNALLYCTGSVENVSCAVHQCSAFIDILLISRCYVLIPRTGLRRMYLSTLATSKTSTQLLRKSKIPTGCK